ncbi:hypothetical protein APP_26130 [Aeribacillus pallidus]|nr:hypothetical protein APP_26130 [Aeribacillus pallidus]
MKDKNNRIKFVNVLHRGNEVQQEAIVCVNVRHKTFGERNEEREHKKNILTLVVQT